TRYPPNSRRWRRTRLHQPGPPAVVAPAREDRYGDRRARHPDRLVGPQLDDEPGERRRDASRQALGGGPPPLPALARHRGVSRCRPDLGRGLEEDRDGASGGRRPCLWPGLFARWLAPGCRAIRWVRDGVGDEIVGGKLGVPGRLPHAPLFGLLTRRAATRHRR